MKNPNKSNPGKAKKKSPKVAKVRIDKRRHLILIDEFVSRYIIAEKKFPSNYTIADNIGLSRNAVDRLIKEIDLKAICGNHASRAKLSELLWSLLNNGKKGNTPAAKLWLQLAFEWVEKQSIEHSGQLNILADWFKDESRDDPAKGNS